MNKFDKKSLSHYTFEVGRYEPTMFNDKKTFKPYEHESTKRLVWNVLTFNDNSGELEVRNVFEYNWPFKEYLLQDKRDYGNNFKKFAEAVRISLSHEYWARCEYEMMVEPWIRRTGITEKVLKDLQKDFDADKAKGYKYPRTDYIDGHAVKLDVYTQVMLNWEQFIQYLWDNKRLITKKKLGL